MLMLAGMSGIYAFGAFSGNYSFGRLISYIVLILHIAIAQHLAILENKINEIHVSIWLRRLMVPATVLVFSLLLSLTPLRETLSHILIERLPSCKPYLFLSRFTGQYDVVLSDIESSWLVPTFGGKVVAARHPLSFVPGHDARKSDVRCFFSKEASSRERRQILKKYRVDYLLLRKSVDLSWRDLQLSFLTEGSVVYESDNFVLISLKPGFREKASAQKKATTGPFPAQSSKQASANQVERTVDYRRPPF